MRAPCRWLVGAALWGACAPTTEITEQSNQHAASIPSAASCKTEPPVAIALTSRVLEPGRYELTAIATPTKDVGAVELALVLPPGATTDRPARAAFGATGAGEARTLVAIVDTIDRTSELSAIARVPIEGIDMSRAATLIVGDPKPVARVKQYTLPDGERAREVRP
jgi:hypothetical protein